jgi:murein peptide amidase A
LIAAAAVALVAAGLAAPQHAAADRTEVIGHSRQGRPIVARELGDRHAQRRVLVVGSIHGNETQGRRVVDRLRHHSRRLRRSDLWTIETVNPDGVAAGTRGNARGVDLNRNFATGWKPIPSSSGYYSGPKPFSEPETRGVRRFLRRLRPDVTIWYHQPFGRTLIPCNRRGRRVALRYARLSRLPPRDCYPTPPGAATGWQDAALHEKAFVAEFGPGALSRSQVRRHARAVLRIAG